VLSFNVNVGEVYIVTGYLNVKDKISLGEKLSIEAYCINWGSVTFTGFTEITIFRRNTVVFYKASNTYSLPPGKSKRFRTEYTPGSTGPYLIELKCNYLNNFTRTVKTVVVGIPEAKEETNIPPPPISFSLLAVEYPQVINVTEDMEYTITIKVRNEGNQKLNNLKLVFMPSNIYARVVYPLIIPYLEPKEEGIFVAELKIPKIRPGSYIVEFSVISDETSAYGAITVVVSELSFKDKAESLLDYYESVLQMLETEIEKLKEKKNLTKASILLENTWKEWRIARRFYELGLYDECIRRLDDFVRKNIDDIVAEIERAQEIKPPKRIITFPAYIPTTTFFIVVLAILFVILLLFLNRRRRYTYRSGLIRFKRW